MSIFIFNDFNYFNDIFWSDKNLILKKLIGLGYDLNEFK